MEPERWRQIELIYHACLEHEESERAAFLQDACGNDVDLRREVESLLRHQEKAENFIERPALEIAAQMVSVDQVRALTGRTVGRYLIVSQLGAGGMGEVYRARDGGIGREVAIKMLTADCLKDKDLVRRFDREARAAGALNHPNILAIFDVGNFEGSPYIVSELLEGETLRNRLGGKALNLDEAVEYAIQICNGLAAAHDKGVLHRDLKPENLFITKDGPVKILDFGLAKLTRNDIAEQPANQSESALNSTKPGVIMGTVQYMSPEQATGQALDRRSDIFSFGVVLYEMAAGRRPFNGANALDTINKIVNSQPESIAARNGNVPDELSRIILKCLEKTPQCRYQTARELLADLNDLKLFCNAETGANPNYFHPANEVASAPTVELPAERIAGADATAGQSKTESLIAKVKANKRGMLGIFLLIPFVAASIGWGWQKLWGQFQSKPTALFQNMKITQLTSDGKAFCSAISPDGKYVAYVNRNEYGESLWLRQTAAESSIELIPASVVQYLGLRFSPDGNFIYYTRFEKSDLYLTGRNILYRIPALGGASQKIFERIQTAVTFSPDGSRIAFRRRNWDNQNEIEIYLMTADSDGNGAQKLAARTFPDRFFGNPAWSPDGKTIAFSASSDIENNPFIDLYAVRVADGVEQRLTSQKWSNIGDVAWLGDGSGLIACASDAQTNAMGLKRNQLWQIDISSGEARRITNDLNNYEGVSLTSDSGSLAAVQYDVKQDVWLAPNTDVEQAKLIIPKSNDFTWTSDGKIVYSLTAYSSAAGGATHIWIMDPNGAGKRQLTSEGKTNIATSVSRDGRYIFFYSDRSGAGGIWRMDIDGGNPKQLVFDYTEAVLPGSPDGKWVFYFGIKSGKYTVWKVPIDGGKAEEVIGGKSVHRVGFSPDGKLIAYLFKDFPRIDYKFKIGVMPVEGGEPLKIFDLPDSAGLFVGWTPDSQAVTYTSGGNLWSQPLDGGPPKQLTDFKSEKIIWCEWSRDGKQFAFVLESITSDVVLLTNFK